MRRSLAKFPYSSTAARSSFISSASAFSTSSSGGGRGRGSSSRSFIFTKDDHPPTPSDNSSVSAFGHGQGGGRGGGGGRGKPPPSSPNLPPFSSFVDKTAAPSSGLGRGRGRGRGSGAGLGSGPISPPAQPSDPSSSSSKAPILSTKDGGEAHQDSHLPPPTQSPTVQASRSRDPEETPLPSSVFSVLSGAGRGKPQKPDFPVPDKPKEENRHIRPPQQPSQAKEGRTSTTSPAPTQRLSREEAVKKAVGLLSRGEGGDARDGGAAGGRGGRGRGRGIRGRGGPGGRGSQAWRGRGGRGDRGDRFEDAEDDDHGSGLYLGDNADGEKLAQRLGPDVMDELAEAFEEMSSRVLPSPVDDAYLDALHTNLLIECEPEYMMGDFESNPDIDEKPPISLRDALEKMKPFLMAYEGIQSQQEWEEVVEDTMKRVPLLKEIVDSYSGPDRVTAKQQQEELERVAKTLPQSAPASVKSFTDRAVLSLQSNPGWGFDKKCQLMDKLVLEMSQHYK